MTESFSPATEFGSNEQSFELGKAYGQAQDGNVPGILDNAASHFRGSISDVRLWTLALGANELNRDLNGTERGLAAWWQFEAGQGSDLSDTLGNQHGSIKGATWITDPNPQGSSLKLYHNGVIVETQNMSALPSTESEQFAVARGYKGNLDEVRIWNVARSEENILDNLFGRLQGERKDLVAYYTFDRDQADAELRVRDNSLQGNHLMPNRSDSDELQRIDYIFSTAPIGDDIALVRKALEGVRTSFQDVIHSRPAVEEYGDLQYTATGDLVGAMKRSYSFINAGNWQLYTGFKVGNIITEWIGQVQFDPQVMGYVEGAPPIPSEGRTDTQSRTGSSYSYYQHDAAR